MTCNIKFILLMFIHITSSCSISFCIFFFTIFFPLDVTQVRYLFFSELSVFFKSVWVSKLSKFLIRSLNTVISKEHQQHGKTQQTERKGANNHANHQLLMSCSKISISQPLSSCTSSLLCHLFGLNTTSRPTNISLFVDGDADDKHVDSDSSTSSQWKALAACLQQDT